MKRNTSKRRRHGHAAPRRLTCEPLEERRLLAVVINEIMYHPSSENSAEEYIELHNTESVHFNLRDWRISDGVEFTFPDVNIPAGGYLVVAADPVAFAAKYPGVNNVIGGWTGQLSNGGERIEIEDINGDRVDQVTYADGGDWAQRQAGPFDGGHTGWEWSDAHDGGGRSLELINPLLSNNVGQNWAASRVDGGTPGAPNSTAAANIAPLILEVKHDPPLPTSTDAVTVTARLADELATGVSASVFYRESTTLNQGPFLEAPMFDDGLHGDGVPGDGVYGAVLPPRSNGAVVEFYVRATDAGANVRTWPAPASSLSSNEQRTTPDASTGDNDGVLNGPIEIPVAGVFAGAADFDGGYVQLEQIPVANSSLGLESFTLAAWFRRDGNGQATNTGNGGVLAEPILSKGRAAGGPEGSVADMNYFLGLTQVAGQWVLAADYEEHSSGATPGLNHALRGVTPLANGVWHHAAATYHGASGEWSIYLNGVLEASDVLPGRPPNFANTKMAAIGTTLDESAVPDGAFNGAIDEVYIIDGALTPAGLQSIISSNFTSARVVGHWPLDEVETEMPGDDSMQVVNALYQVDDIVQPDDLPLYRIIMSAAERAEFNSINRFSDAQMNATFISTIGGETEVRYRAGVRIRGSASRTSNPPNNRVNLPSDQPWHGVTRLNLNTVTVDDQIAGAVLHAAAGLLAADASGVRVLNNGVNLAGGGIYAHVETLNGEFVENHLPDNDNGNLYKGRRSNESPPGGQGAGLVYFGPDPAPYVSYQKLTNENEADWSDVIALTFALNETSDAEYLDAVKQVVDIDQWLRTLALNTLLDNNEGGLFNGDRQGDDYVLYSGTDDPRFQFVPHDLDTLFGNVNRGIFRFANVPALARLLAHPEVAPLYYQQLADIIENVFEPEKLNALLRETVGRASPGRAAAMASFLIARGQFVLSLIPRAFSVGSNLPVVNGYAQTSAGAAQLAGQADAMHTERVLVNGLPADWNSRTGAWSIVGVPLRPGVNRLTVQALGAGGKLINDATIDIWRDTGAVQNVQGVLRGDVTWDAASGPYHVTGNLNVPAGSTLTILPGTTVFFDAGAQISINGQLVAEGEAFDQIRFTRLPGGGTWNGLQFANSMNDNRISHAVLEYGMTNNGMVGLDDSSLTIDHATFDHTTRRRIRFVDSTLIVRNSTFDDIAAPGVAPETNNLSEHIWGGGVPDGGRFLIENNFFGHTTGHNDAIDIDGVRLPGPIFEIIGNVFAGGGDDALDVEADVYIEGNTFRNFHKDVFNTASGEANVFSFGAAGNYTVVRNIFENNDHVAQVKDDSFMTFVNNTVVGIDRSAIYFDLPGRSPGRGAYVDGNIFVDTVLVFDEVVETTDLTVTRSIVNAEDVGRGVDNLAADPRFVDPSAGDYRLGPGSPAVGAGPNGLDIGALVASGVSISGEPSAITADTMAQLSISGPGVTHYRYRLNGGPVSADQPIDEPLVLTDLPDGEYTVSVVGRNFAGVWQDEADAALSKTWTVDRALRKIIINEVLAANIGAVDHEGTLPDVIELYNAGGAPVNLAGLSITDDLEEPTKFTFPSIILGVGEYLSLYADDPNGTSGVHLGFGLSVAGEGVFLFDSGGRDFVDGVAFGLQIPDLSIGRDADGEWRLNQPTLGAENVVHSTGDPAGLFINEWLAHPGRLFGRDRIELFNPDPLPVALAGLHLTDNPLGEPARHPIAPLSFIAGAGYGVFIADSDQNEGPDHVDFRLASLRGQIALLDADLQIIDSLIYHSQGLDRSSGRFPDGAAAYSFLARPTFGAENVTSSVQITPIFAITDEWRYDDSGDDLQTAWREPDFDDSAWPSGAGLLYFENSDLPAPKSTEITLGARTFYFRREFDFAGDPADVTLTFNTVIDDGAVIHLNGNELFRPGMEENVEITAASFANRGVGNASFEGPFTIIPPPGWLVQGRNVIAVEVHQSSDFSTDVVFGLTLDAVVSNDIGAPQAMVELLNGLRVTEVMYNPNGGSDFEFIELQNVGPRPIALDGVQFTDGIGFTFPDMELAPGAYVVVAGQMASFRARYGDLPNVVGPFTGNLSNGGEQLRLELPAPFDGAVLEFEYNDAWRPTTDGGGFSLVLVDATAGTQTWNEAAAWRASLAVHGSPGRDDSVVALPGDTNADGRVDLVDLNNVRNNFGAVGPAVLGDTNGDNVVDLSDLNNVRNNFGAMAPAPQATPTPAPQAAPTPEASHVALPVTAAPTKIQVPQASAAPRRTVVKPIDVAASAPHEAIRTPAPLASSTIMAAAPNVPNRVAHVSPTTDEVRPATRRARVERVDVDRHEQHRPARRLEAPILEIARDRSIRRANRLARASRGHAADELASDRAWDQALEELIGADD